MARRSSGRRTDYTWDVTGFDQRGIDIALAANSILSSLVSGSSQTLFRTRGQLQFQLDPGGAVEQVVIAVGIIVIKTAAVVAGVAAVPGPFTEGSADWLWHNFVNLSSGEVASPGDTSYPGLVADVMVDSKAMRRLKEDESVALIAEVASANDQAGTWDVQGGLRILTGS